MDSVIIGVLALVGFLFLMFAGIPVPFSMLFAGVVGTMAMTSPAVASQLMVADLFNTFSNYALTVGPMFGLMGFYASYSGIGEKLFITMNHFIGHRKNGLANAVQVASAAFGAISGSPPPCISTMCAIAYPEMRSRGYMPELAASTIIAGAGLSLLIPPSNTFITYGIVTETSIGKLFMAGIIPGIICMVLNIITITYMGWRHPEWTSKATIASAWKVRLKSLFNGGLIAIAIVFIISIIGMFAGVFTPTEAGAVGAFALLVIALVTRQMNWGKFKKAMFAGARLQAMIFMLLACANVFGKMVSVSTIPIKIGVWVAGLSLDRWMIMSVIIIIYLIIGCFAEMMSITLITMPIFFPIVCGTLGYDPIWFGIMITLVSRVGSFTPPVGSGVFITRGCLAHDPDATLTRLFRGVWPFAVASIVLIVIVLIFPSIITWLPEVIYATN